MCENLLFVLGHSLLYPEPTSAFWKNLTLTIRALLFKILYSNVELFWFLYQSISTASFPSRERKIVPRCPCLCLQLISVPENPFPCRCTNGTHIVSICVFYSVFLFVLVIRAFELWVPSEKGIFELS